jgi:MFS family permease
MYNIIKKDTQIKKFSMYGFFKNLKFFEPYLYLFLLSEGYSLFFIGVLFAIREAIVYIFEIPSGIFADYYGKKKELMLCFLFYIVSFIFFFMGTTLTIVVAMMFFGLGEAFRSGTHKAMIISYLEQKDWADYKTFVYGRTRSFSLLGSALSSLLAIGMVLVFSNIKVVFLITIIPYIIDFSLIASYPESLDEPIADTFEWSKLKALGFQHMASFKNNKPLMKLVISSALFDGIHKTIKDYIQPIIVYMILFTGFSVIIKDRDMSSKIVLGLMYSAFYLSSSFVSKNLYKVTKKIDAMFLFNITYILNAALCVLLVIAMYNDSLPGVIVSFLFLFLMKDGRRPLFVELSSQYMKKRERATMLSIESQIRAVLMICIGPIFGAIAELFGLEVFFIVLSLIYIVSYVLLKIFTPKELTIK